MGEVSAMPTTVPQLLYAILLLACMVIGFLSTLMLKQLYGQLKDHDSRITKHGEFISKISTAHNIHHPGELDGH